MMQTMLLLLQPLKVISPCLTVSLRFIQSCVYHLFDCSTVKLSFTAVFTAATLSRPIAVAAKRKVAVPVEPVTVTPSQVVVRVFYLSFVF
jgi:hypothetical protein